MAASPTLETVITAIKTAMDAISPTVGTVLTGFHGYEDDIEAIQLGGYISSGSMNVWFIDLRGVIEVEGPAPGEIYERYDIAIRYWSLRTANADWSKEARQKAEAVRDALSGASSIFRISSQIQLQTPETVNIVSHGQANIRGSEGDQLVYLTELALQVEARRW